MQTLLAFAKWYQSTSLGTFIRTSTWVYPFIQLIHFSGLSLWVGTIIALDMRVLKKPGEHQIATRLNRQLLVWNWTGLCVAIVGGLLLFSATATSFLANPAFQTKIPIVLTGIVYHFFFQRNLLHREESPTLPTGTKIAALVELLIWIAVVTAAVEIPDHFVPS